MHLVIDASNIFNGGGLTHLKEFVKHAHPEDYGFGKVVLWSSDKTLDRIEDKKWLKKSSHPYLNKSYAHRFIWKHFVLKPTLEKNDILFIPGTGYLKTKAKVVTMCRNLLPLDLEELNRYKGNIQWYRLRLLRALHFNAFKKADGVIFLNEFCFNILPDNVQNSISNYSIIPHGINRDFCNERESYKTAETFKLLNISSISLYRHQWNIVEAVAQLREEEGINFTLDLIGPPTKLGMEKLNQVFEKYKSHQDTVRYVGTVPYEELSSYYQNCDAFIYSSTCETFGMTLLEAMAHYLPIACSEKSSMPEMLKNGGVYFDPENLESIKVAILKLYEEEGLRKTLAEKAFLLANEYSWKETAHKTLSYLKNVQKNKS